MTDEVLTAQQVFDRTLNHIRKQMVAAIIVDGTCMYRGPAGTSCAVGCHLTDEEVGEGENSLDKFPDSTVKDVAKRGRLPIRLMPHLRLLSEMQFCHDTYAPSPDTQDASLEYWELDMECIARDHNLIYTPPQTNNKE